MSENSNSKTSKKDNTALIGGVLAAGAVTALTLYAVKGAKKALNAKDNLFFDIRVDRVHGLAKGVDGKLNGRLRVMVRYEILNNSTIPFTIDNITAAARTGKDELIGLTPKPILKMTIPYTVDPKTKQITNQVAGVIAFDFKPNLLNIINESKPIIKIKTTFYYRGLQQNDETIIDLTAQRNALRNKIQSLIYPLKGLDSQTKPSTEKLSVNLL